MKAKPKSLLQLNFNGRPNEAYVMLRGQCIGKALKCGFVYRVTWNNGEESEFDSLNDFQEIGLILAASYGYD